MLELQRGGESQTLSAPWICSLGQQAQRWVGSGPEVTSLPGPDLGLVGTEGLGYQMRWPRTGELHLISLRSVTNSAITLEPGRFPVGKRKMILPGWLQKQPQQGAGKCVSKHGSGRHSRALLGAGPRAGRGTRGSRKQPNPGGEEWGDGQSVQA